MCARPHHSRPPLCPQAFLTALSVGSGASDVLSSDRAAFVADALACFRSLVATDAWGSVFARALDGFVSGVLAGLGAGPLSLPPPSLTAVSGLLAIVYSCGGQRPLVVIGSRVLFQPDSASPKRVGFAVGTVRRLLTHGGQFKAVIHTSTGASVTVPASSAVPVPATPVSLRLGATAPFLDLVRWLLRHPASTGLSGCPVDSPDVTSLLLYAHMRCRILLSLSTLLQQPSVATAFARVRRGAHRGGVSCVFWERII